MPSPLEIILDPISLLVFAMYFGLMLAEQLFPGRALRPIKGWRLRGLVSFTGFFFVSTYLPLVWDVYLQPYQIMDLRALGAVGGTLAGIVAYELVAYLWHRSMHRFDWLWRGVHQMHHSAERLDTAGAFYFSPLGMIAWSAVGSIALVLGVGIVPQAATLTVVIITFLGIFQHANLRTPHWLGYLVQRPEMHTLHHAREVHAHNYADIAVVDMLFGSFRNPKSFEHDTGFYEGASARISDMLLFRDVSRPPSMHRLQVDSRPGQSG